MICVFLNSNYDSIFLFTERCLNVSLKSVSLEMEIKDKDGDFSAVLQKCECNKHIFTLAIPFEWWVKICSRLQ